MEKATTGLESTALWSVIEITDFALRHGRKVESYLPTVAGSEDSEHLTEKRLLYSESDSGEAPPRGAPNGSERPKNGQAPVVIISSQSPILGR